MAKKDYTAIRDAIVEACGGAANIANVTHCMTRLRVQLRDGSKLDQDDAKKIAGVLNLVVQNGEYQFVIGQDVPSLYEEFTKLDIATGGSVEDDAALAEDAKFTKGGMGEAILSFIGGTFSPVIPVLVAGGLTGAVLTLLTTFVPLITMLVTVPVTLIVLGPIGNTVGTWLSDGVLAIYRAVPPLAVAIVGLGTPWLVFFGMNNATYPVLFALMAEVGSDPLICTGMAPANVAVGVNAGILWDITDQWSVAMSYRSRMNMKVNSGHATMNIDPTAAALIQQLGQLSPGTELIPALDKGTFRTELPLPTTVTWGVSFRPTKRWELAVDLQWVGWSAYKDLNVSFNEKELGIKDIYSVKNYSNTLAFRFGGQYRATDFLTARMGMYVDESPVSSDYLNPETPSMTKVAYTAGLSLRPTRFMSVDLAYCYVSSADPERTGSYPVYNYTSGSLEEVFSGNYKLHAHVFSVGVRFSF